MSRKKPSAKLARTDGRNLPQRVLHSLQRHDMVRAGERVGVAVSGGADSVALLLFLLELRERLGIVVSVAHFNHKLRGRASDADEKFVAKLAAQHGLTFHVERVDVAAKAKREKANLEDAARRARYAYFARLVEEGCVQRVAVAHTADDQAETVLGHILRGTGLAGLGGIYPVSGPRTEEGAGQVIRPLLEVRRAELRQYLRARKQSWREDMTNLDTTRTRARIRRKLLPLLERQFQPAVVEHLSTLAELAREDEAFLKSIAKSRCAALVKRTPGETRIAAEDLLHPWKHDEDAHVNKGQNEKEESNALAHRIVRMLVEECKRRPGQVMARHIAAVLELARHGQSGKSLMLPGGVEVRRDGDMLVFLSAYAGGKKRMGEKTPGLEYQYNVELGAADTRVRVPELGCAFRFRVIDWPSEREETKDVGAALDRNQLRTPLVLRNWHYGDRMRPTGHQKAHKLKRLLNDKRVSRWERQGWPVLTSGGVLAWARGFPAAAEFAADERTRAAVLISEQALG